MLEKRFHLTQNGTSVKKEVLAGLTTFFAMVYNPMVGATVAVAVDVEEAMKKHN